MRSSFTIPLLAGVAMIAASCGGTGAFESRPSTQVTVPNTPPGSGQLGPGFITQNERRMYGAGNSTGEVNTNGVNGGAERGAHQEHNRLPGTGNRP